jgi:hypothetical protein
MSGDTTPRSRPGITGTGSEAEAARGVDLVLSVNTAKAAVEAFRAGLPGLRRGALWADLNTASPGTKRQLASIAEARGVPFADVAMMAPVPGRGLGVPMLASGDGAARYAGMLNPLGANTELLDGTRRHALRRTAEMEAATDMLSELGVPPLIAEASRAVHERLSTGQEPSSPSGQRTERFR